MLFCPSFFLISCPMAPQGAMGKVTTRTSAAWPVLFLSNPSASLWTRRFAAHSPGWQQPFAIDSSLPSHCKWKSDTCTCAGPLPKQSLSTPVWFLLVRLFTALSKTCNFRRKIYFGSWFRGTQLLSPMCLPENGGWAVIKQRWVMVLRIWRMGQGTASSKRLLQWLTSCDYTPANS